MFTAIEPEMNKFQRSYTGMASYAAGSSAVSPAALAAEQMAAKLVVNASHSQALWAQRTAAVSQLLDMAFDCDRKGWDGDGSVPINPDAFQQSIAFIRAFPESLPFPEFAPEPDGSISLDWIWSANRLLSLSIGASSRLAYAWLDGEQRGHGVVRFDGTRVPERILAEVFRVMLDGNARLRSA